MDIDTSYRPFSHSQFDIRLFLLIVALDKRLWHTFILDIIFTRPSWTVIELSNQLTNYLINERSNKLLGHSCPYISDIRTIIGV